MRRPRISLAQIRYFDGPRKHNVEKIKKYIRLAKKDRSDIVCFPEVCITERGMMHMSHAFVKEIQAECERNSIWCIISDEFKIRDREYNLSVLIDRKGRIAGNYKKINLYYEEVVPGKRVKVFDTDFARIGIVICWDMAFPELFLKLKQKGAQIIFCPALWWYEPGAHTEKHIERERSLLKSLLQARAFENLFYVGVCNPIVESRYQVSYTAIAAPHYIMGEISNREGLLTESINLRDLKRFKELYQKK